VTPQVATGLHRSTVRRAGVASSRVALLPLLPLGTPPLDCRSFRPLLPLLLLQSQVADAGTDRAPMALPPLLMQQLQCQYQAAAWLPQLRPPGWDSRLAGPVQQEEEEEECRLGTLAALCRRPLPFRSCHSRLPRLWTPCPSEPDLPLYLGSLFQWE
jgi:hypothetical protein